MEYVEDFGYLSARQNRGCPPSKIDGFDGRIWIFDKKSHYLSLQGVDIGPDLELVKFRGERELAIKALLAAEGDMEVEKHC